MATSTVQISEECVCSFACHVELLLSRLSEPLCQSTGKLLLLDLLLSASRHVLELDDALRQPQHEIYNLLSVQRQTPALQNHADWASRVAAMNAEHMWEQPFSYCSEQVHTLSHGVL